MSEVKSMNVQDDPEIESEPDTEVANFPAVSNSQSLPAASD